MPDPHLTIVPAADADLERWVDVRNRVEPRTPATATDLRFMTEIARDRVSLLALLGDDPVGAAYAETRFENPDSEVGEAVVRVLPEARRRGVGEALLRAASEHLRGLGKTGAQGSTYADEPEALAFLAKRGFVEVSRNQTVQLDLAAFRPSGRPPPDGVEITDLAARPELLEGVWRVDCEAGPDVPGPEPEEPMSLERFARLLEKPGLDHRLVTVAVAGGEPIGYAWLVPMLARPDVALHWLTGVLRSWRGRGVAGALKEAQLARARELGIRMVRTNNELRNEPIRRLNARLGYRPEPDHIILRGPLLS